jgi:hypothetical protein
MTAELPLAECTLDLDGLRRQRDRYRRLGRWVESIGRWDDELVVRFAPSLDDGLLRETIAVEAECCPFYRFDYAPGERRLRIGVGDRAQLPALGALAFALGPADDPGD